MTTGISSPVPTAFIDGHSCFPSNINFGSKLKVKTEDSKSDKSLQSWTMVSEWIGGSSNCCSDLQNSVGAGVSLRCYPSLHPLSPAPRLLLLLDEFRKNGVTSN